MLSGPRQLIGFLAQHPLTRGDLPRALGRVARWQIESRLRREVAVPWVAGTRLLVRRGMTGATGNIYAGLHEFAEMAFVLHLLRAGDLFADIGANVGSYTVLAAGVRRARVVAVEPGTAARAALRDNVDLNGLGDLVRVEGAALGASQGRVAFTTGLDTTNHVLDGDGPHEEVEQTTVDALFSTNCPALLKLDVEGSEAAVLAGAAATLRDPTLKAMIVELNGSGRRYGFDDGETHRRLLDLGFSWQSYAPFTRELEGQTTAGGANRIYVRDLDWVRGRLESAPVLRIFGDEL
jgi:FkbM family methyltransferase